MKRIFTLVFGMLLLATPALALAGGSQTSTQIPLGQSVLQLATVAAALEAQESALSGEQSLACAMLFSATGVKVGQQVILAWGSVGAVEQTADTLNIRPTNGAVALSFSTPGAWTYTFKFYGANGGSVLCTAKIQVG